MKDGCMKCNELYESITEGGTWYAPAIVLIMNRIEELERRLTQEVAKYGTVTKGD